MGKIVRIELAEKINNTKIFLGVGDSSIDDEDSLLVFGLYKNEVTNDNKEAIEWELDEFGPSFRLRSVLSDTQFLTVIGEEGTGELQLGIKTLDENDEYALFFTTAVFDTDRRILISSYVHPTYTIAVNTSGFRPAFLLPTPILENFYGEWLLTYL